MKENDFKKSFYKYVVLPLLCLMFGNFATAQTSYAGDGSTIYFNGSILSNQVVVPSATATVNMTASTTFTGTGYVDGVVNVLTDGSTEVPVGDGATKSTITVATANTDDLASVEYTLGDPASISSVVDPTLTDYYLSDTEFWEVTKVSGTSTGYSISGTTANGSATYEGSAPTGGTKVVWYNGAQWEEYTGTSVTGYFSYVGENSTLSTGELNISQFNLYPNPAHGNTIGFTLPSSIQQLDVTMYDITGKVVQRYNNVPVQAGANSISKPQVANGMYLLQFSFNNGAQTTTKRLIIK